jgi:hypothetical protein
MFGRCMFGLGVVVFTLVALTADVPATTAAVVACWVAGTPYAMFSLLKD